MTTSLSSSASAAARACRVLRAATAWSAMGSVPARTRTMKEVSVRAIAADFLAGERIHAKPKGLFALGYESARRHRIIATFSAIALVGLVLILIQGGQVDYLEELDEIRDQANLDLAVQRIDELAQRRPERAPQRLVRHCEHTVLTLRRQPGRYNP